MNTSELKETVEMCWKVACTARLIGVPDGMAQGQDMYGNPQLNSVRYATYQVLLQTQTLPKKYTAQVETPKENWQSDEE